MFSLREAEEADEDFLFNLFCEVFGSRFESLQLPSDQLSLILRTQFDAQRNGYRQQFPNATFSVIHEETVPVGQCVIARNRSAFTLVDISVLKAHRGNGIATQLVASLLSEASENDVAVHAHVSADNPQALALWKRLGFQMASQNDVYVALICPPAASL